MDEAQCVGFGERHPMFNVRRDVIPRWGHALVWRMRGRASTPLRRRLTSITQT
jgi:hypothetical protein